LEVASETAGAFSLAFVTLVEFRLILSTGWRPLLAMFLVGELSFLAGYHLSGPAESVRRVMALGASNRNIALAILIGLQSFAHTAVVAAVTANGLLLIFLGLLHVAYWRYVKPAPGGELSARGPSVAGRQPEA
jgi:BASS family bile acid:Na+ symporter